ncbi:MAG: DMT family transporter [Salibacter sp.]|nr:DMT family transporter [Salibacter sp.]
MVILFWGFTGILGKLISIDAFSIVWIRMLIAFVSLFVYLKAIKFSIRTEPKRVLQFIGVGFIVAIHWITFFHAIKISTVSVALATLATATLFTSFLEPLFFKRRIIWYEILFGGLVVAGLVMIFNFETEYTWGIITALVSAFTASLFTTINGKLVSKGEKPRNITMYEMLGGTIGITLFSLFGTEYYPWQVDPTFNDWIYLVILGVVCTAYAFVVSVNVMRELSPFTVSISINMEPVYSILLALLFFGDDERMSLGFYGGALLILSTILANAWLKKRLRTKRANALQHSPN